MVNADRPVIGLAQRDDPFTVVCELTVNGVLILHPLLKRGS